MATVSMANANTPCSCKAERLPQIVRSHRECNWRSVSGLEQEEVSALSRLDATGPARFHQTQCQRSVCCMALVLNLNLFSSPFKMFLHVSNLSHVHSVTFRFPHETTKLSKKKKKKKITSSIVSTNRNHLNRNLEMYLYLNCFRNLKSDAKLVASYHVLATSALGGKILNSDHYII